MRVFQTKRKVYGLGNGLPEVKIRCVNNSVKENHRKYNRSVHPFYILNNFIYAFTSILEDYIPYILVQIQ